MIVDLTMYFPRSKLKKEKLRKKDAAAPPFNILTRLSNAFKRLSNVNGLLKRCMAKNGKWRLFSSFFSVRTGIKMAIYFKQYLKPIRLQIIVRAVTKGGWGAPLPRPPRFWPIS